VVEPLSAVIAAHRQQLVINVVLTFLPEAVVGCDIMTCQSDALHDVLQGHQPNEGMPLSWPARNRQPPGLSTLYEED